MSYLQLLVWGAIILFAIRRLLHWHRRYRGARDGSFKPPAEVFRDPASGKMMRVYEDTKTGLRQYREEG